jgi:uncharacterized protein YndB with AHSA1/START domain
VSHSVEHSVVIARPVEEVFDYWADPANAPQWRDDVVRVEGPSGPLGVGAEWVEVQQFAGRDSNAPIKVTAYERPSRMAFSAKIAPGELNGTATFAPSPDGGTVLRQSLDFKARAMFKPMEGKLSKTMGGRVERDLEKLRSLLEGGR